MKRCRKVSKILILCLISSLYISYNNKTPDENNYSGKKYDMNINVFLHSSQHLSALSDKAVRKIGLEMGEESQYNYLVRHYGHLADPCYIYGVDGISTQEYFVPVLLVEIPDDKEKEERINEKLTKRYVTVLPDPADRQWWKQQELRITYHSGRFLCFRYFSNTELPAECNDRDLYFTLDVDKENIIDYPVVGGQTGKYEPYMFGDLYRKLEEYQEKTVEEQSGLKEAAGYQLHEVMAECEGISFPCVEVEGLTDKKKQEQINSEMQEPLRAFIKNGIWEDRERAQKFVESTKIYIAYQTEEWLSVVYSIQVTDYPDFRLYDGIRDLGITISIKDGKRVLLGDLFEKDRLLDWFYAMGMYDERDKHNGELGLLLQTEEEKITEYKKANSDVIITEVSWLWDALYWNSFYLYRGKLIILGPVSYTDFEIPLPEICEYLKVDPWYD